MVNLARRALPAAERRGGGCRPGGRGPAGGDTASAGKG